MQWWRVPAEETRECFGKCYEAREFSIGEDGAERTDSNEEEKDQEAGEVIEKRKMEVKGKEDPVEEKDQEADQPLSCHEGEESEEDLEVPAGEQDQGIHLWGSSGKLTTEEFKECFDRWCPVRERAREYGQSSDDEHRMEDMQEILEVIPGMADDLFWARRKGTEEERERAASLINKKMEELQSIIWQLGRMESQGNVGAEVSSKEDGGPRAQPGEEGSRGPDMGRGLHHTRVPSGPTPGGALGVSDGPQ